MPEPECQWGSGTIRPGSGRYPWNRLRTLPLEPVNEVLDPADTPLFEGAGPGGGEEFQLTG